MASPGDRHKLNQFVAHVWYWLRACYLGDGAPRVPWPIIRVAGDLRDYAESAWREFENDYPLERLQASIGNAPTFVLTSHGLYGAQLDYKLHLVERAARQARSGGAGFSRRFIDLVDNVLDSLGPTGLAGGLKELKDALVGSLPERE